MSIRNIQKYFFLIILACFVELCPGQNLVPNPGFEETRACPKSSDYIGGVVSWNLFPNFSADYFNRCAGYYQTIEYLQKFPTDDVMNFSVPRSMFGYQEPHGGNAYAGISFCNEALSVKLIRPLVKDSLYRAEFFVNLTDSSSVGTRYFGMYFSQSSVRVITDNRMLVTGFILDCPPQIQNPSDRFLTDTANWVSINGVYKAQGGEQYITIAGFHSYHDSLVQPVRNFRPLKNVYRSTEKSLGYYLIDDVSVVPYQEVWEPEAGKHYVLQYVYFEFDKSDLLPASSDELNRLVGFLNQYPAYGIQITGHTDNIGDDAYNLRLSNDRAKSVANYLLEHGVDPQRISSSGEGNKNPVAGNDTESGRQQNRRVEFVLTE